MNSKPVLAPEPNVDEISEWLEAFDQVMDIRSRFHVYHRLGPLSRCTFKQPERFTFLAPGVSERNNAEGGFKVGQREESHLYTSRVVGPVYRTLLLTLCRRRSR